MRSSEPYWQIVCFAISGAALTLLVSAICSRSRSRLFRQPHAVQRRLAEQDLAFALASLRHDRVAVILESAKGAVSQIFLTHVDVANLPSPNAPDGDFAAKLPQPHSDEVRASLFARSSMPVALVQITTVVSAIAAVIFLVGMAATSMGRGENARKAAIFATLFLFGVAANAAVTGALSSPTTATMLA